VPRNEDGEFELILGNRQLMSVFFIVVILLGVFFAMGYIVGRGSPLATGPDVATRRPESKPLVETPPPQHEDPAPEPPKSTASQQGPAVPAATQPAAAPVPVKPSARANTSAQPESGKTYLQLSAIDHDAAEIMVELLRKKSFAAITAEVPEKPGVFRVLVGPVAEADVNKIRTDLQNASFPGKDAIKRTF
jgi:cell division septation protein DedD